MNRIFMLILAMLILVSIAGCAPGPNELADSPDDKGDVAGFWHGVWHGFIVLFTFIISLFKDNVRIYEVHNNGNLYNFGYLLGIMVFFGGGGGSACKRPKRR